MRRRAASHHSLKGLNQGAQSLRLRIELLGSSRSFFSAGGRVLGYLLHLGDRLRDLIDALDVVATTMVGGSVERRPEANDRLVSASDVLAGLD